MGYTAQKAVVIGSTAMKHHFPDFPRIPMDRDVIIRRADFDEMINSCNPSEIKEVKMREDGLSAVVKWWYFPEPFEYLFADGQTSLELILDQLSDDSGYATPEVLYSIKKAHIHFPIKFKKHIQDLQFLRGKLREKKGIEECVDLDAETDLLDSYPALTEMHFAETEKRVGKLRTPRMDQTKEKFFGKSKNYVTSYYEHDIMHMALAHCGEPTYWRILKDGSEVETDIEKWKELSLTLKMYCVLEEVYVIALERKILPWLFNAGDPMQRMAEMYTPEEAFEWALNRVCTNLCDGFFREFAVRAYDMIKLSYNHDYVNKFFKNISKYERIESD